MGQIWSCFPVLPSARLQDMHLRACRFLTCTGCSYCVWVVFFYLASRCVSITCLPFQEPSPIPPACSPPAAFRRC
jgi:hypothetical protein